MHCHEEQGKILKYFGQRFLKWLTESNGGNKGKPWEF